MTLLSMEHISRENPNCEMSSVSSLQLSHRALTNVSCLSHFLSLERLDLSYNCLTSLEGLSSCVNLKWLQVLENKLVTLKGIEGLSKLTVLNAGRNKLEKIDEICALSNLRAIILNDNNISSICNLDQMKYLNTLGRGIMRKVNNLEHKIRKSKYVIVKNGICSHPKRNPIHAIGNSLKKVTSMTKLSLSHCKLQTIGSSSLAGCMDLKEARFSHNEITALPEELAKNIKLRTLDIGNNLIEKFSEVKVLSTLRNLKNLNLLGNPIAENEKIVKKVKRLLPNIRIFNAKPSESSDMASERGSLHPTKADSLLQISSGIEDNKRRKMRESNTELLEKKTDAQKRNSSSVEESIDSKAGEKKPEKNSSVGKVGGKFKDIDDEESPFVDLVFSGKTLEDLESEKKGRETVGDAKLVKHGKKVKKRTKTMDSEPSALQFLSSKHEVGMGGHSTWDD